MILVKIVNGVRVDDRRPDLRDDLLDEGDRRVALRDAGVLQVSQEQPGADDVGGLLRLARPAGPCRRRSAPRDMVRMATASPAAPCAASVPPAPISTSSGCAPTASTVSLCLSLAARPASISSVALATRSPGLTGFIRNSAAAPRSAETA